jgi:hypothetical protein
MPAVSAAEVGDPYEVAARAVAGVVAPVLDGLVFDPVSLVDQFAGLPVVDGENEGRRTTV